MTLAPAPARARAAAFFAQAGLPTPREEAWKYTNLRDLRQIAFAAPAAAPCAAMPAWLALPGTRRIVFVDGVFASALSTPGEHGSGARLQFGPLARPDSEAFTALNTMMAEDGAWLVVPAGVDAGVIQLISLASGANGPPVGFHPRHHVELGAGARLTLVECAVGEGLYLHNAVSEIEIGAGACLAHVRLQDESAQGFHIATLYAQIDAGGVYDAFTLTMGARLSRTEIHARLIGPGARAHLNAAQLLRGAQHGDFTTVLAHEAPSGQSRQTVRTVLDDQARGVFQGRIEVARAAQKTDGYQMNHALLLSPLAEIDSKPELRINADDVKCSHGATVGELDADALFYLRSRGVALADARAMLIRGFLARSLADIADPAGRTLLEQAIERWWERVPA